MKPLTREWIGKAEGDLATVRREVQARKAPNYDAACFHAQQCMEAKTLLTELAQVKFWIDKGRSTEAQSRLCLGGSS